MAATQRYTPDPESPQGVQARKLLARAAKVMPAKPLTNPSNGRGPMGTQVQGGARITGSRG